MPFCVVFLWRVIPLREKMGNYDCWLLGVSGYPVIPLREKMGNYDNVLDDNILATVIPLREKMGNGELRQCLSPKYFVRISPHIISAFTVFVNPQMERNVFNKNSPWKWMLPSLEFPWQDFIRMTAEMQLECRFTEIEAVFS